MKYYLAMKRSEVYVTTEMSLGDMLNEEGHVELLNMN